MESILARCRAQARRGRCANLRAQRAAHELPTTFFVKANFYRTTGRRRVEAAPSANLWYWVVLSRHGEFDAVDDALEEARSRRADAFALRR